MGSGSKEYFDDVAAQWDEMQKSFFSDSVKGKAFAAAGVAPGKLAADIGAGAGFITRGLIDRGLKVIAVDQSAGMLDQMRAAFGNNPGIDYRVGQAEKLPIADSEMDYVFANMFLHHVCNPEMAVQEMVRILKSNGRLVVTDMNSHTFEFLRSEQHDRWLGFMHDELRTWFASAGLESIKVENAEEKCSSSSVGSQELAEIEIFLALGTKP